MKFNFKIQPYQTDAVDSVINVFKDQPFSSPVSYIRDLGKTETVPQEQLSLKTNLYNVEGFDPADENGFKNEDIALNDDQLLKNIHDHQNRNNIKLSPDLIKDLGRCSLDIEMETGTGKTYVYIKSMFELYKQYGWSKFIVVVPSIAIREGGEEKL